MEMNAIQECTGGITAAQGFVAGGVYCGIRKVKKDIALVQSVKPAVTAGVFTLNKVIAAPLVVDKLQLQKSNLCSAIVINSGNANACTGEQGLKDAWAMVDATAQALHVPREQVLVSSTGVIGQYLPMEKIVFNFAPARVLWTSGQMPAKALYPNKNNLNPSKNKTASEIKTSSPIRLNEKMRSNRFVSMVSLNSA